MERRRKRERKDLTLEVLHFFFLWGTSSRLHRNGHLELLASVAELPTDGRSHACRCVPQSWPRRMPSPFAKFCSCRYLHSCVQQSPYSLVKMPVVGGAFLVSVDEALAGLSQALTPCRGLDGFSHVGQKLGSVFFTFDHLGFTQEI